MNKVIVLVAELETTYRIIHVYNLNKRETAETALSSCKSLLPHVAYRLLEIDFTP